MKNLPLTLAIALGISISAQPLAAEEGIAGKLAFITKKKAGQDKYTSEFGGRGLLTTEGPSGVFLNPTSGTLPRGSFTAQYCTVSPNNSTSPLKVHGMMFSYGVTDWLELGALVLNVDFHEDVKPKPSDLWSGGPMVRIRLQKQEGNIPQISIGSYCRFGDVGVESYNAFAAAFYRIEISRTGFFRSVGLHAGIRQTWVGRGADRSDAPVGYGAVEIELPYHFSLMGEVSTADRDSGGGKVPYGVGVQWRYGILNVTMAALNNGAFNEPSLFWGIGPQFNF